MTHGIIQCRLITALCLWLILIAAACTETRTVYQTQEVEVPGNEPHDTGGADTPSNPPGESSSTGNIKAFTLKSNAAGPIDAGDSAEILRGSKITLEWDAESTSPLGLYKDGDLIARDLPPKGSFDVQVDDDAVYTLSTSDAQEEQFASITLTVTDTICLLQKDCRSNAGLEKGLGFIWYYPHLYRAPDGTLCIIAADSVNNRVVRYCGDEIENGTPGLVLGQTSLSSNAPNRGGAPSMGTLNAPKGVWSDGEIILVADTGNHRVLFWRDASYLSNGAYANFVLGQSRGDKNDYNIFHGSPNEYSLYSPSSVWFDRAANQIFIYDERNNRVVIRNGLPTANGGPFNIVMGQADFIGYLPNRGGAPDANTLGSSGTVSTFDGNLIISDTSNNRVLIFRQIPTGNGVSANIVIGQAEGDFASNRANRGAASPSASSLSSPTAAFVEQRADNRMFLWVSDLGNSRILRFPVTTDEQGKYVFGQEADLVLGADDFTHAGSIPVVLNDKMVSAGSASPPAGCRMAVAGPRSRILLFDTCAITGNNPSAIRVIGQPDFLKSTSNRARISDAISNAATQVIADEKGLWVTDSSDNRVIGFRGIPPVSGARATSVMGQADFISDLPYGGTGRVAGNVFYYPRSVFADRSHFIVSDHSNSRLLIWRRSEDGLPTGQPVVLGQPDLTTATPPTAGALNCSQFSPASAIMAGDRLFIADTRRSRVLVYRETESRYDSEFLIGQGNCSEEKNNRGRDPGQGDPLLVGPDSLNQPSDMSSDGEHLLITDQQNNRLLFFDSIPTAEHIAAIRADPMPPPAGMHVIGQPGFTGRINPATGVYRAHYKEQNAVGSECSSDPDNMNADGALPTASTLRIPGSAILYRNLILVADTYNNRVLVFCQPTDESPQCQRAIDVIGQRTFQDTFVNAGGSDGAPGPDGLNRPGHVWMYDKYLLISDSGNARVVVKNIEDRLNGWTQACLAP